MYDQNFQCKTGKLLPVLQHEQFRRINRMKNNYVKERNITRVKPTAMRFSVPGVDKLLDSSYKLTGKVVWLAVLIATTVLCTVQMSKSFLIYFGHPIVTDISIVQQSKIIFPAVYLCSGLLRNLFQTPLMREYENCDNQMDKCKEGNSNSESEATCFLQFDDCKKNVQLKAVFLMDQRGDNLEIEELWTKIYGIRSEKLKAFTACEHMNKTTCEKEGLPIDITKDLHMQKIMSVWGQCVILHRGYEVTYRGPLTYLKIIYNNPAYSKNDTFGHNFPGMMLYVHHIANESMRHFLFASTQEILQGFFTHVVIEKKVVSKHRCVHENLYYQCIIDCYENLLRNANRSCSLPYMPSHKLAACSTDVFEVLVSDYLTYSQFNAASCNCLAPCMETIHAATTDVIVKLRDPSQIILKIYFSDDTYTLSAENDMYIFSRLLSDIGGNFGFFLGLGCLTIIEAFEFIFTRISRTKCCRKLSQYHFHNK